MIAIILSTVVAVVAAQLMIKVGVRSGGPIASGQDLLSRIGRPLVVGGLALYVLSAAAWIYVLANAEVSFAFPFLGLTYVGVAVIAVFALRERFTGIQWVGLALVMIGVTVVAWS